MREVFVDSVFWIALLNPQDDLHSQAQNLVEELNDTQLITTQEVMIEVLNYFSNRGPSLRTSAVGFVQSLELKSNLLILEQSEKSYHAGIALYAERSDKAYSATDCISMSVTKERTIRDVLTTDQHFQQEGLTLLLE